MALDKTSLQNAIKDAFKKAKQTAPPADPKDSDKVQTQILDQLSLDLANAINTFVRGGDVIQVEVEVRNPSNAVIGTGKQGANRGKVE